MVERLWSMLGERDRSPLVRRHRAATPEEYAFLATTGLDVSVQDLAYLYAAHARDKREGTSEASSFKDAVRQHHLIDEICRSSERFWAAEVSEQGCSAEDPATKPHQSPRTDW